MLQSSHRFSRQQNLCHVFARTFTNIIEDKGRFGKLLAPGRKRKAWEVERDHNYTTTKMLEKDNKSKDKVIQMLREEVKDFNDNALKLVEAEEKLARLYEMGIIDSSGEVLRATPPSDDPDEMK